MFVYNLFRPDVRVLKEARTLTEAGNEVTIVAIKSDEFPSYELINGIRVYRIERTAGLFSLRRLIRLVLVRSARVLGACFGMPPGTLRRWILHLRGRLARSHEDSRRNRGLLGRLLVGTIRPVAKVLGLVAMLLFAVLRRIWRLVIRAGRTMDVFINWRLRFRAFLRSSSQILEETRFDVFHAHDLNTLPIGRQAALRHGAKLVYDSHELYPEISTFSLLERSWWTRLEKRHISASDRVITVCDSIAGELESRYGIARPEVLLNCPPTRRDGDAENLLREKLGLDASVPVALYQGGYTTGRGLDNLIRAAAFFDRAVLVMMGWGKTEAALRKLADELGLSEKVLFVPPVEQDVLLDWTASADVGMIPYLHRGLNNYYCCPNKLFEYIHAGIAVAGSDFPEIRKILSTYNVGLTFDPEKPRSIAEAVNGIVADAERLAGMKRHTRQAREDLNWEKQGQKLLGVYASLAEGSPASS